MKQSKDDQQPPSGKQPLVSRVAELLLIRNMQEDLNQRTQELAGRSEELKKDGLSPVDELLLKRLLHKQANVAELFQRLLESAQQTPPDDGKEEDDG